MDGHNRHGQLAAALVGAHSEVRVGASHKPDDGRTPQIAGLFSRFLSREVPLSGGPCVYHCDLSWSLCVYRY